MARNKEPHMFDDDEAFGGGVPDFKRYHDLWGESLGRRRCGSHADLLVPPPRIRDYNPAMKWVRCASRPRARLALEHGTVTGPGRSRRPSTARCATWSTARPLCEPAPSCRAAYAQLERLPLFPREQCLVLRSDWLRNDPARTIGRVLEFLGVGPMGPTEGIEAHVRSYPEPLDPGTRAKLAGFFEPEIRRLEALLGWDLSDWRR
ncbi:MAG: hypothetical protein IPF73_18865 [Betaproteobacteria bacterium]|nr:hypothetical protein [Betaproteobacteria bacterium]